MFMTRGVHKYCTATWRHDYLQDLLSPFPDGCLIIHLRQFTRSGNARYVFTRKNHRIFQKKIIDIRLASSNLCRHGTVCKCETSTALHGHQLERGGFETSARGMASVNKHDLSTKTYPAKYVLRLASFSSRGSGSCDKKANS